MPGPRWLRLRRSLSDGKLVYYVCYAPRRTPLETLVRVAGMRWTIEECFEAGEVELDHYDLRSWHGWYQPCSSVPVRRAAFSAATPR
ncbi:hypothetical protein [Noviherbaspirillum sedimenti]|uniref:hypothetical protein n=1 Tax=Noviherbaspirillum sedimenti TaxID=2320865 RepID=UPI0011C37DED